MKDVSSTARDGDLGRGVSEELLGFVEEPRQYIDGAVKAIQEEAT